jgi:hypothetical protein
MLEAELQTRIPVPNAYLQSYTNLYGKRDFLLFRNNVMVVGAADKAWNAEMENARLELFPETPDQQQDHVWTP